MDYMLEERKKRAYDVSADRMLYAVLCVKLNDHEKRVTDIESELNDLCEWIHSDNHMTNDDQFFVMKQNESREEKRAGRRLENITLELSDVEDKKLQVQIVGDMVDEIRVMLKDMPKQKNNYRRQLLLMLHEALKQNYTKAVFSAKQVRALAEVARVCGEEFVTREQYFQMDDILCESDLDMLPCLE